jgi:hypothetical protein
LPNNLELLLPVLKVISIENTNDQLFHGFHFVAFAGGHQQGDGSQRFVTEDGIAVLVEQQVVSFQE